MVYRRGQLEIKTDVIPEVIRKLEQLEKKAVKGNKTVLYIGYYVGSLDKRKGDTYEI